MEVKGWAVSVAVVLVIAPHAALACPNVASASKWLNSPIIVEGTVVCQSGLGRCTIKVEKVRKGKRQLRDSGETLTVAVRPYDQETYYCGIEWTPFEDNEFKGRVFLKPGVEGMFTAPYWPDSVQEEE